MGNGIGGGVAGLSEGDVLFWIGSPGDLLVVAVLVYGAVAEGIFDEFLGSAIALVDGGCHSTGEGGFRECLAVEESEDDGWDVEDGFLRLGVGVDGVGVDVLRYALVVDVKGEATDWFVARAGHGDVVAEYAGAFVADFYLLDLEHIAAFTLEFGADMTAFLGGLGVDVDDGEDGAVVLFGEDAEPAYDLFGFGDVVGVFHQVGTTIDNDEEGAFEVEVVFEGFPHLFDACIHDVDGMKVVGLVVEMSARDGVDGASYGDGVGCVLFGVEEGHLAAFARHEAVDAHIGSGNGGGEEDLADPRLAVFGLCTDAVEIVEREEVNGALSEDVFGSGDVGIMAHLEVAP